MHPFPNHFPTIPRPFQNRSTTVSQPVHNRSTTVPQPFHNRFTTVSQPFLNGSSTGPQPFINRSTTFPAPLNLCPYAEAGKAVDATARHRELLGVEETEPLANLSVSVDAAFSLLDARGLLWDALARWYEFLAFLEGADVFAGEIVGRAEDFEQELSGAEAGGLLKPSTQQTLIRRAVSTRMYAL